jgi:phosphatidate phosphatase PAH1
MKIGEAGEAFFVFETEEDVPEDLMTSPILQATTPQPASGATQHVGRFGAKDAETTGMDEDSTEAVDQNEEQQSKDATEVRLVLGFVRTDHRCLLELIECYSGTGFLRFGCH